MNARCSIWLETVAVIAAASLSACHSAPTRLYTLYTVPASSPRATYSGPAVRVDSVHVPPALDRIEVVRDMTPGELKISDLDHWSAPLGQSARQTLSADMVSRLPPGRVIFPHLAKPEGTLGISVDVLDFRADTNGTYLEASWLVSAAGSSTPPAIASASLRTGLPSPDAAATATALSVLLGQLADRIAAGL
jgi:uncharacterized lipoprotein YmbA